MDYNSLRKEVSLNVTDIVDWYRRAFHVVKFGLCSPVYFDSSQYLSKLMQLYRAQLNKTIS